MTWGSDYTITAGGGTNNVSNLPAQPNEFFIKGTGVTLLANWTFQLDPLLTPQFGDAFRFHWDATVTLNGNAVTMFGTALSADEVAKQNIIDCIYDGSQWVVNVSIDNSEMPLGVSGSHNLTMTAGGGTVNLDPEVNPTCVVITGSPVLVGSWTYQGGGTPVAGNRFRIWYGATPTVGGNTVTLFGVALTSTQAASGQIYCESVYNGAAWVTKIIESKNGVAPINTMYEAGAGTGSIKPILGTNTAAGNYGTVGGGQNNAATGNDSFAVGNTNTASGAQSFAAGGSSVANNIYSVAHGLSCTASGQYSFARGSSATASGRSATASGNGVVASGTESFASGYNTIASGEASSAQNSVCYAKGKASSAGGSQSVANLPGSRAWASGTMGVAASIGDSQIIETILKVATGDAVATQMIDLNSATGITIPTDCVANVYIRLSAVQYAGVAGTIGDSFSQNIKLCVKDVAGVLSIVTMNAITLANYSTVAANVLYELSACDAAFAGTAAVSVIGNKLHVTVTGEAAKDIVWTAYVSIVWTGYGNFSI